MGWEKEQVWEFDRKLDEFAAPERSPARQDPHQLQQALLDPVPQALCAVRCLLVLETLLIGSLRDMRWVVEMPDLPVSISWVVVTFVLKWCRSRLAALAVLVESSIRMGVLIGLLG